MRRVLAIVALLWAVAGPAGAQPDCPEPGAEGDFDLINPEPGRTTYSSEGIVATGDICFAVRLGEVPLKGRAKSLIYEHEPTETGLERHYLLLAGDVELLSPAGTVRANTVHVLWDRESLRTLRERLEGDPALSRPLHDPSLAEWDLPPDQPQLTLAAHGALQATYDTHTLQAQSLVLELTQQVGLLTGDVRIRYDRAPIAEEPEPAPTGVRPLFEGIEFAAGAIAFAAERCLFGYNDDGIGSLRSSQPVVVTMHTRKDTDIALTCQGLEITFAPGEAGLALERLDAPRGIRVDYDTGSLTAGSGVIDFLARTLTFTGQVLGEQEAVVFSSASLTLAFDEDGNLRARAEGHPAFGFQTRDFAPLKELFDNLNPSREE